MIPLDRNESYWLLTDELVAACKEYGKEVLSTYPDYIELKNLIAKYAGVPAEYIALTPGSDAAIQEIARAYVGAGEEALLPVPTFYGYESILNRVGARTTPVFYTEENGKFVFPEAALITEINKKTAKAVFLCHPNNPLGSALPELVVKGVVEACRAQETVIVSDEAYFEFSGKTLLPYLKDMPNLIIVRTLSKGFGLSGARIGYVIARPEVIQKIQKLLLPWPIAHTSVAAALALLNRQDDVFAQRNKVIEARGSFAAALAANKKLTVYPSETNFLLVRVPNAELAQKTLLDNGVRVALAEPMSQFPEARVLLKNALRIAIPSPEDQDGVIQALRAGDSDF